jgi:pseudouridine-5'-phosphate glycosidase
MAEAAAAGVSGKRLTPFLLARIAEVTGGAAVAANRALALANAEVAAALAVALAAPG